MSPTKTPGADGFIQRWLILEPIPRNGQLTDSAVQAAIKNQYFPDQLAVIPHDGDKVTVEARLFDVPARRDIPEVGRRVSGSRADVPRMAHRFADQLLEVLTGERGPFDTQIVFTSQRNGNPELYAMNANGSAQTRLTMSSGFDRQPDW